MGEELSLPHLVFIANAPVKKTYEENLASMTKAYFTYDSHIEAHSEIDNTSWPERPRLF